MDSTNIIDTDLKKTFIQQVLGPRGGLFALGIFLGMFVMHIYMTQTVISNQNIAHAAQINSLNIAHTTQQQLLTSQIAGLETRVKKLELDKDELGKKLAEIAFDKMPH